MSTPRKAPDNPVELGRDGSLTFYRDGSDVVSFDGVYWRPDGTYRAWLSTAVARRIARRNAETDAQRVRERAIVEAERRRLVSDRRVR